MESGTLEVELPAISENLLFYRILIGLNLHSSQSHVSEGRPG